MILFHNYQQENNKGMLYWMHNISYKRAHVIKPQLIIALYVIYKVSVFAYYFRKMCEWGSPVIELPIFFAW